MIQRSSRKEALDIPGFEEKSCGDRWHDLFFAPIPESELNLREYAPLHWVTSAESKMARNYGSRPSSDSWHSREELDEERKAGRIV